MSEENPWKTLSSKIVYRNAWIQVREDQVLRPDGLPGIYGVVETRVATGVVALTPEHEVYLVGQYRYPTEEYSWEIIEGGGEKDEPYIEAAKRELREEAGLTAEHWTLLGPEVHLSNCHSSEIGVFFLAEGLTHVSAAPEVTEVLQLKKVPFNECMRMVQEGKIKDAMSIIAIYRMLDLHPARTVRAGPDGTSEVRSSTRPVGDGAGLRDVRSGTVCFADSPASPAVGPRQLQRLRNGEGNPRTLRQRGL